jgi:hypothetical protein
MDSSSPGNDKARTRQEVRAEKRRKKHQKIKQHGKGLAKMYRDAIRKRLKLNSVDKREKKE